MQRERVLFLCTGNSARSQMAEAILRDRAGDRFEVLSAGLEPSIVRAEAIAVLVEHGIDIEGLRSKDVREYIGTGPIDHLITLCSHAEEHCPRTLLTSITHEHWPLEDPAAVTGPEDVRTAAFRASRDEIVSRIDAWLASVGRSS